MTGPDVHDDTTADHEQFETERIAQDRNAARTSTAAIDETTAPLARRYERTRDAKECPNCGSPMAPGLRMPGPGGDGDWPGDGIFVEWECPIGCR